MVLCVKVGYGAIFLSEHHVITNAFDALNQELIRKTRRHNTRRPGHGSLVRPPPCCIPGLPTSPPPAGPYRPPPSQPPLDAAGMRPPDRHDTLLTWIMRAHGAGQVVAVSAAASRRVWPLQEAPVRCIHNTMTWGRQWRCNSAGAASENAIAAVAGPSLRKSSSKMA